MNIHFEHMLSVKCFNFLHDIISLGWLQSSIKMFGFGWVHLGISGFCGLDYAIAKTIRLAAHADTEKMDTVQSHPPFEVLGDFDPHPGVV